MAKKRVAYALSAAALVAGSGVFAPLALAEEVIKTLESCEGVESCAIVTSTAELSAALNAGDSTIVVGSSFDLTADLFPSNDFTLYLNNYTITSDGLSFVPYGSMTIYAGENGKVVETGGEWAPFYIHGALTLKSGTIEAAAVAVSVLDEGAQFTMDGGTIRGGSSTLTAVNVSDGARMVMNDGAIDADTWGVSVFKNSEFEMNGGIITANSDEGIGVAGNGSVSGNNEGTNARLILNAGTIHSGDLGVYAPQINGETVLGDGLSIDAGKCGVEVRAGELSVEGATINVDADTEYRFDPNGSGSTASGVAVAVAQHTTQQAITATVSGGVFTAPVAFAEGNPQKNPDESIEQVELSITGGEFNATNGEPVVASEDVEKFISGGIFNKEINESYIADNYSQYPANQQTVFVVMKTSHTSGVDDTDDEGESDAIAEELGNVADDILGSLHDKFFELTGDGAAEFTTNGGAKYWIDDLEYAANVLWDGRTIIAALDSEEYNLDEISDEERALVEAYLQDGMVPFAALEYWIDLMETDGASGGRLGVVTEIPYAITLTYDVSEAPAVPEGMIRTWNVVRLHWVGNADEPEVTILPADYDAETGLISYENDKFSAFIITYTDAEEASEDAAATPDTGTVTAAGASAMSAAIITAVAVGLLTSIISFAYLIRKH